MDKYLEKSEQRHIKNECLKLYKYWRFCKDKKKKEFIAKQYNKLALIFMERSHER